MTEKYIPLEAAKKAIDACGYSWDMAGTLVVIEIERLLNFLAVPVEEGAIKKIISDYNLTIDRMDHVAKDKIKAAKIELAALRRPVDREAVRKKSRRNHGADREGWMNEMKEQLIERFCDLFKKSSGLTITHDLLVGMITEFADEIAAHAIRGLCGSKPESCEACIKFGEMVTGGTGKIYCLLQGSKMDAYKSCPLPEAKE
jgi:hypothetical protein